LVEDRWREEAQTSASESFAQAELPERQDFGPAARLERLATALPQRPRGLPHGLQSRVAVPRTRFKASMPIPRHFTVVLGFPTKD
jgi:hypothetical protein